MRIQTQAEQYPYRVALCKQGLSEEEKAELARQFHENGGYTYRNHPGDGPKDGFMVSLPGAEEISPADRFTGEIAADFDHRRRPLVEDHEDNYNGAWNDREHNDAYLDVSRNHKDLWDAVEHGYGRNEAEAQHEIYHIPTDSTFSPLQFSYNGQPGFMMAKKGVRHG